MAKDINTLPADILSLFDPKVDIEVDDAFIEEFGENIKAAVRNSLREARSRTGHEVLRFSALGKQDRQLWYEAHGYQKEEMLPKVYFKFLYGHVIEALVLLLAKASGHDVRDEQKEVEHDGVFGHLDAIIDGHVVDVKSASPYAFKKFEDGKFLDDDPFGYLSQLSGYQHLAGDKGKSPYFLAFDKVSGDICLASIPHDIVKEHPPEPRIDHLKDVINSDEPPERCWSDEPDGKSGNRKLGTGCSYCGFKRECWPGLRTFLYGNGPRYLTKVERVPDVFEVT